MISIIAIAAMITTSMVRVTLFHAHFFEEE